MELFKRLFKPIFKPTLFVTAIICVLYFFCSPISAHRMVLVLLIGFSGFCSFFYKAVSNPDETSMISSPQTETAEKMYKEFRDKLDNISHKEYFISACKAYKNYQMQVIFFSAIIFCTQNLFNVTDNTMSWLLLTISAYSTIFILEKYNYLSSKNFDENQKELYNKSMKLNKNLIILLVIILLVLFSQVLCQRYGLLESLYQITDVITFFMLSIITVLVILNQLFVEIMVNAPLNTNSNNQLKQNNNKLLENQNNKVNLNNSRRTKKEKVHRK